MKRREFITTAAACGAALTTTGRTAHGKPFKRPRNVLLLMTDQHRADTMSLLGDQHALTPTLDTLATSGGMSFDRAYCQDPVCVPSRAALLTGRYVRSTGTLQNSYATNRSLLTFPQHLRSKGYKTACFGKLHVGGRSDLDWNVLEDQLRKPPTIPPGTTVVPGILNGTSPVGAPAPYSQEMTKEWQAKEDTIRFMEQHKDEPWVIQCSMFKPHPPWQPPAKYWDMIERSTLDIPEYPEDDLDDVSPYVSRLLDTRKLHNLSREKTLNAMQGYYGNLAFCDAMFAEVIAALDRLGLRQDTLIVYVADHGEMLGSHHLWTKFNFFDESVRVPLIVNYPGVVRSGKRSDALVELIDLFPTVMDFLGFETPESVQGRSLMPVLTGETNRHRDYVTSEFYRPKLSQPMRMQFDGRYKVIDNGTNIPPEVYDCRTDPREIHNIAQLPEHSDRVATVTAELRAWAQTDVVSSPKKRAAAARQS